MLGAVRLHTLTRSYSSLKKLNHYSPMEYSCISNNILILINYNVFVVEPEFIHTKTSELPAVMNENH